MVQELWRIPSGAGGGAQSEERGGLAKGGVPVPRSWVVSGTAFRGEKKEREGD